MTGTLREALAALPRPLSPDAPVPPERKPKVISRAFSRLVADLEIPKRAFTPSATTRVACNYALGLTRLGLVPPVLATFVLMLPATALYVYAGWAGGEALAGEGRCRRR